MLRRRASKYVHIFVSDTWWLLLEYEVHVHLTTDHFSFLFELDDLSDVECLLVVLLE